MSDALKVVLGDRDYRVDRSWYRERKPQAALGFISDVAVDSERNVYVCQRIDPPVVVFDREGEYLRSFGGGILTDPHGIFITADDRVLVVDRDAHQVVGFDREGYELFRLGERNQPRWQLPFNHPTDIAEASNGDFYVSDGYGNCAVHWFAADGTYRKTWGQPGGSDRELMWPHGIWVDGMDRVLVADLSNDRIALFTLEGELLEHWLDVRRPMDIFEDGEGFFYVTDETPRLTKMDRNGKVLGQCRPAAYCGHGIAGDASGVIYVAESNPTNRITRLVPLPR